MSPNGAEGVLVTFNGIREGVGEVPCDVAKVDPDSVGDIVKVSCDAVEIDPGSEGDVVRAFGARGWLSCHCLTNPLR